MNPHSSGLAKVGKLKYFGQLTAKNCCVIVFSEVEAEEIR